MAPINSDFSTPGASGSKIKKPVGRPSKPPYTKGTPGGPSNYGNTPGPSRRNTQSGSVDGSERSVKGKQRASGSVAGSSRFGGGGGSGSRAGSRGGSMGGGSRGGSTFNARDEYDEPASDSDYNNSIVGRDDEDLNDPDIYESDIEVSSDEEALKNQPRHHHQQQYQQRKPFSPSRGAGPSRAGSVTGTSDGGMTNVTGHGGGPAPRARGRRKAAAQDGEDGAEGQQPGGGKRRGQQGGRQAGVRKNEMGLSGTDGITQDDLRELRAIEGLVRQRGDEQNMILGYMYKQMDPLQRDRYETFRGAGIETKHVRAALEKTNAVHIPSFTGKVVGGVAKVFVMEIVEGAKAYQAELGHAGPLLPIHLQEAFKRHKGATFTSGGPEREFGETVSSFLGGV